MILFSLICLGISQLSLCYVVHVYRQRIHALERRLTQHEQHGGTCIRMHTTDRQSPLILDLTVEDLINLTKLEFIRPPEIHTHEGKATLIWRLPG